MRAEHFEHSARKLSSDTTSILQNLQQAYSAIDIMAEIYLSKLGHFLCDPLLECPHHSPPSHPPPMSLNFGKSKKDTLLFIPAEHHV